MILGAADARRCRHGYHAAACTAPPAAGSAPPHGPQAPVCACGEGLRRQRSPGPRGVSPYGARRKHARGRGPAAARTGARRAPAGGRALRGGSSACVLRLSPASAHQVPPPAPAPPPCGPKPPGRRSPLARAGGRCTEAESRPSGGHTPAAGTEGPAAALLREHPVGGRGEPFLPRQGWDAPALTAGCRRGPGHRGVCGAAAPRLAGP